MSLDKIEYSVVENGKLLNDLSNEVEANNLIKKAFFIIDNANKEIQNPNYELSLGVDKNKGRFYIIGDNKLGSRVVNYSL